jgi:hypothetical protein
VDSDNRSNLNKRFRNHFRIESGVQQLIHDEKDNHRDGCRTEASHGRHLFQ